MKIENTTLRSTSLRSTSRKSPRGFTLIELLVVIAIISLLVSILLPSLSRAKDLAKRVLCASNMHHVTMAYALYANQYNDCIPVGYCYVKQFNYLIHGKEGAGFVLFGNLYLAGLMDQPVVFQCPASAGYPSFAGPNNPWPPGDPDHHTRAGLAARPEAQWDTQSSPPSPFPKLSDLGSKAVVADWTSAPIHVDVRHKDGVNVGYGDGSAHWVYRTIFNEDLEPLTAEYCSEHDVNMDNIWEAFDEQR